MRAPQLIMCDAVELVRDLKKRSAKGICLMGGELAPSLVAACLVDEIGVNIHRLLGQGIPVFRDPAHRVKLTPTECRPIAGGCILAITKCRRRRSRSKHPAGTCTG
jgi:hypothetical protein